LIAEKSNEISALQARLEQEVIDHILQEKKPSQPGAEERVLSGDPQRV